MGRDSPPRVRQAVQLERKKSQRAGYDRILIVCEGSKTEPLYFKEIRKEYRLNTANVEVFPSAFGTEPIQVVQYAKHLFDNGDVELGLRARAFERVYAVFDRDDHLSYFNALALAASLYKKLRNDARQVVTLEAVASVPSFELWLLLHYEDIRHIMHRDEVMERLKIHIPNYEKGTSGVYSITQPNLHVADLRSTRLAGLSNPHIDTEPYTEIYKLVHLLQKLNQT